MKKIIFSLSIIIILPFFAFSQNSGKVNWYTFEEVVELSKKNPKKIFIDVYTDWCGWCKKMDAETFSHPYIADYLNENFYPVKLNSESTDPIYFMGYTFINEGAGRRSAHQLAIALLQGQMSYPSIVYLSEDFKLITVVPGFMNAEVIEPVLKFISGNHYKRVSYEEFQKTFKSAIASR